MISPFSITLALACASALVQAAPSTLSNDFVHKALTKRAAASNFTDADILNYALTLEHLESKYYRDAIAKYSSADFVSAGFPNTTYGEMRQISEQEDQHVSLLTAGLTAAGATPVAECNYTFPYTSVKEFMALSTIIEGVGTSAYLGAAQFLANPEYVTIAGSILTVEARHTAFLRYLTNEDPFAEAFDTPQTPREIVSIVSGFFASCPSGSAPTIKPFPALVAPNVTTAGSAAMFTTTANVSSPAYCAFAVGATPVFTPYTSAAGCMVPSGLAGQGYVTLSSTNASIMDDTTLAGPAIVDFGSMYSLDSTNVTTGPGINGSAATNGTASPSATGKTGGASSNAKLGAGALVAGVFGFVALFL